MTFFTAKCAKIFTRILWSTQSYIFANISKFEELIRHNVNTLSCQGWTLPIEIESSAVSRQKCPIVKKQELKSLTRAQFCDFGTDTSRLTKDRRPIIVRHRLTSP